MIGEGYDTDEEREKLQTEAAVENVVLDEGDTKELEEAKQKALEEAVEKVLAEGTLFEVANMYLSS